MKKQYTKIVIFNVKDVIFKKNIHQRFREAAKKVLFFSEILLKTTYPNIKFSVLVFCVLVVRGKTNSL